jgi:hypothetical protein
VYRGTQKSRRGHNESVGSRVLYRLRRCKMLLKSRHHVRRGRKLAMSASRHARFFGFYFGFAVAGILRPPACCLQASWAVLTRDAFVWQHQSPCRSCR